MTVASHRIAPPMAASFCLAAVLGLSGCLMSGSAHDSGSKPKVIVRGAPPSYEAIASQVNVGVARLECLRASVELKLTRPDEHGEMVENEAEANLQFISPSRVALRIEKAAQVRFWLGSDESKFWWIDLSAEPATVLVGSHAGASRARVESLGVPVRPLDLVGLLGLSAFDPSARARVGWSPDGRDLLVDLADAGSIRRTRLDPDTLEPRRVEIYESGKLAAYSTLSNFANIPVRDDSAAHPRMATRIEVSLPRSGMALVINLYNAENPGIAKMKPKAFDLAALREAYGVQREVSLDEATPKTSPAKPNVATPAPPPSQPAPGRAK